MRDDIGKRGSFELFLDRGAHAIHVVTILFADSGFLRGSLGADLFVQEIAGEVDLYHSAVLSRARSISSVMLRFASGDRAAGRVRCDNRRFRHRKNIGERLVGDVRDVHHHAKTVHLGDDLPPEVVESAMARFIARGVCPVVGVRMRQGHVARP